MVFSKPSLSALTTLLLALTISCGFHLRGTFDMPPEASPLYIGGQGADSELQQQLTTIFEVNNVTVTDHINDANYRIIITALQFDRRTIAIGGNALTAEYQLMESVTFELQNEQGSRIMGPQTIIETRLLENDPNRVISTSEQENVIRREMKRSLAAKVARQVSAFDFENYQATHAP